jgi:DNA-binding transcriptional MerR regulator
MEALLYTPSQVAKNANCHPNSIRNWSKEYADLLSPGASGEAGPRLYTDKDAEILYAIAVLRKSGVQSEEVGRIIRERVMPPYIDVTPQDAPQALQTPTVIQSSTPDVYNALQAQIDALARRVDSQPAELRAAHRDRLWIFVAGLTAGVVIAICVVYVMW